MKVDTRLYLGNFINSPSLAGTGRSENHLTGRFAVAGKMDPIQQKRKEARKKAMDTVKQVFDAERSVEDDLKTRASKVEEAWKQIKEAQEGLKENQELPPEVNASDEPYRTAIEEAYKVIVEENAIIRGINLERLKSHPMTDAASQAEDMMEAANKEIIGMLAEQAKDTIDQEMDETKEEMDAAKEKQKEQDEYIEEVREHVEEMEAAVEKRREEKKSEIDFFELPQERLLELDAIRTDVQQEVHNILSDMKLLAEDIKGSVVNEII